MKPNDDSAKLPAEKRPFRILVISGSQRREYNCPGVDSKSGMLMLKMAEMLPQDWEIDYGDLGNVCRYGGIEVPDNLWRSEITGKGKKYSDNQSEDAIEETGFMNGFSQ